MKKRIFSCFMALALCLTLLPATAQAEDGHSPHPICGKTCSHTGPGEKQHQNDAFKNAKWMASYTGKLSVGSPEGSIYGDGLTEKDNYVILTTGYYYLSYTADGCDHSYVRSLKTIKIQGDVTICLNGKQIQNIGDTTGPVFEVPTGSTLTLTDCTGNGQIIRDSSFSNGSGVYVNGGTLNLYSGQITKSTGQQGTVSNKNNYGGGVYVSNNGTFTMNGNASIKSNTAKNGGGVYASAGTFNMNGNASIKSNTGNGVCVSDTARFTVSDTPTVTENTMNGNDSNVYLNGGAYITIGDYGLHGSAGSIGVTKTINPKAEKTVIATGKNALLAEDAAKFKSDKDGYAVSVDTDDTKQLVLKMVETPTPEHTHKWEYELSGDNKTITATCTGEGVCAVSNNGGSVTIKASTTTHDGNPKPATLEKSTKWQSVYSKDITITYEQKKGDAYKKIDGVPTEVGKYKASITVGGKTAFVEYEITGGTPEIVPVSQITLNKAETSISVGNSETLTATVAPENAANKALTWASSDEDVATVAPDGTVTAVKAGTATITATATSR